MKNFEVEIYNWIMGVWCEIAGDFVSAENEHEAIDLVRSEQMQESATDEESFIYEIAQYRARIADRDEYGSNNHTWIYDEED